MQICIIGGGVVGLNIALELCGGLKNEIFLLEQEKFLGHHTSTRNSEVIHAGFAYPPGSLKARLCAEGNRLTYELLEKLRVPHRKCGKWIVACNDSEADALDNLLANAKACGVGGIEAKKVQELEGAEPNAHNIKAVAFSATSGIMDAAAYIRALEVAITAHQNANVIYPCKVTGIDPAKSALETTRGPIQYDVLINSAGLWADEIHAMICRFEDFQMCARFQIVPFKGEYYTWKRGEVKTMIYPVPEKFLAENPKSEVRNPKWFDKLTILSERERVEGQIRNPKSEIRNDSDATLVSSMGIHIHRNMGGEVLLGPSQIRLAPEKKSDYTINTPPKAFVDAVSQFVTGLDENDLAPAYAGNRPKLFENGRAAGDFQIFRERNVIHLLGIESPGLTAAPAIARLVCNLI